MDLRQDRYRVPISFRLLLVAVLCQLCLGGKFRGGQCELKQGGSSLWQGPTVCPLPLDDRSGQQQESLAPWKLPPRCVRPNAAEGLQGTAHCLYVAPFFRGQGVGVLASPETAADIVGAGALDEELASRVKAQGAPGPVATEDGLAYAVAEVPGKGKGARARRLIRKGEVFMIDFPALIAEKQFMAELSPTMRRGVLRRAFEHLPETTQKKILDLAKSTGGDKILDVFMTNTCSIVIGDGKTHMGLFPEVSRMNHACKPNAFYRFSPRTLTIEVAAYHDIQPGEEININYAFLGMPYKERREFLRETWGFKCTCSLCRATAEEKKASDDRRMRIVKVRDTMSKARQEGKYEATIESAQELIELYEDEELLPLVAEVHDLLARTHLDAGDLDGAEEYGRLALEGWVKYRGIDSDQAGAAVLFLRKVQKRREGH